VSVGPAGGPAGGATLSAYVYVPTGTSPSISAKLYVQDAAYAWHQANPVTLAANGSWTHLTYLATGYTGNAIRVGLQLNESPSNTPATVYLDSVSW
jgi:hypothetical protein